MFFDGKIVIVVVKKTLQIVLVYMTKINDWVEVLCLTRKKKKKKPSTLRKT